MGKHIENAFIKYNRLIVVTGTVNCGKSIVANEIKDILDVELKDYDRYRFNFYDKYGYLNSFEKEYSNKIAKYSFIADILSIMRTGMSVIVRGSFITKEWQFEFDRLCMHYDYKLVVINCKPKDELKPYYNDNELLNKHPSVTASKYIKGETYSKLSDSEIEALRTSSINMYIQNGYTNFTADYELMSDEVLEFIKQWKLDDTHATEVECEHNMLTQSDIMWLLGGTP